MVGEKSYTGRPPFYKISDPSKKIIKMVSNTKSRYFKGEIGDYIGLLSIGDVLRATLIEQDRQIKALNKIAS